MQADDEHTVTIELPTRVSAVEVVKMCRRVDEVAKTDARRVVIDMRKVEFLESNGFGGLVYSHHVLLKRGKSLVLFGPPERVTTMLKLSGMEGEMDILPRAPEPGEKLPPGE